MAAKKKVKLQKKSLPQGLIFVMIVSVIVMMIVILVPRSNNLSQSQINSTPRTYSAFDFGNQKMLVDGQLLTFVNGTYKSEGHAALITNRHVNSAETRAVAIIADNPGGSGIFYYLVGAMRKDGKEVYSQPILLGDRIKPVSVSVDDPQAEDNGIITVTYLDRPQDAPMAAEPTQEVMTTYAFEDNGNLIMVLQ